MFPLSFSHRRKLAHILAISQIKSNQNSHAHTHTHMPLVGATFIYIFVILIQFSWHQSMWTISIRFQQIIPLNETTPTPTTPKKKRRETFHNGKFQYISMPHRNYCKNLNWTLYFVFEWHVFHMCWCVYMEFRRIECTDKNTQDVHVKPIYMNIQMMSTAKRSDKERKTSTNNTATNEPFQWFWVLFGLVWFGLVIFFFFFFFLILKCYYLTSFW